MVQVNIICATFIYNFWKNYYTKKSPYIRKTEKEQDMLWGRQSDFVVSASSEGVGGGLSPHQGHQQYGGLKGDKAGKLVNHDGSTWALL